MKRTKQSTFARRERSEKSTGFAPVGGEDMTAKTAQFTPGPWAVDADYEDEEQQAIGIVKDGQGYIAGIHILASCNNGEGFTAEDRANAHLIAAAPAMYEALQEIDDQLDQFTVKAQEDLGLRGALLRIRDALAQAEGR